ncbi:MAG: DUF2924 domain-containing protein [Rhodobacteraceae bacterium]|nr:DUF2924 domain-containing protein [Paracoccaceae bacterium]
MNKPDPIPARLAALKTTPTPDLKQQWRELFDSEPPPFNRRYLESRWPTASRNWSYGGLKPETVRRLERLGEELDGGDKRKRSIRADRERPITGTRLLREWQGVEQIVTVTADGFEWQGRPYRSLSAIARAITGTRWNGWVFFGLKKPQGADMTKPPEKSKVVRKLRCAVYTANQRKGWSRSSTRYTPA